MGEQKVRTRHHTVGDTPRAARPLQSAALHRALRINDLFYCADMYLFLLQGNHSQKLQKLFFVNNLRAVLLGFFKLTRADLATRHEIIGVFCHS